MSDALFLKITLPAIAIPALIVFFLPRGIMPTYVDVVEPLALFIGSLLALRVSFMYRKELRAAFLFFSAFLLSYLLAIVFLPYLQRGLEATDINSLVLGAQFLTYSILFLFCFNLLKIIIVKELNRNGWIIFALASIFSITVAIYPELEQIKDITSQTLPYILYLAIRVFDAFLIAILVPVLWLYVQHLKSQHRQSLAFTVIIFGIVASTILDYLFSSVVKVFPHLLPEGSALHTAIPHMVFIYGFLMIAVGLWAHLKQDEWGYGAVDSAMGGALNR